jgi:hypothetical protein
MTSMRWSLEYPLPWNDFIAEEVAEAYKEQGLTIIGDEGLYVSQFLALKTAIENAEKLDREAINEAIAQVNFKGPTGVVNFDKNHVGSTTISIGQWQKSPEGKWILRVVYSELPEVPTAQARAYGGRRTHRM